MAAALLSFRSPPKPKFADIDKAAVARAKARKRANVPINECADKQRRVDDLVRDYCA